MRGGGSFLQKRLHDLVGRVETKRAPPELLDKTSTLLVLKHSGRSGAGALPGLLGKHREEDRVLVSIGLIDGVFIEGWTCGISDGCRAKVYKSYGCCKPFFYLSLRQGFKILNFFKIKQNQNFHRVTDPCVLI